MQALHAEGRTAWCSRTSPASTRRARSPSSTWAAISRTPFASTWRSRRGALGKDELYLEERVERAQPSRADLEVAGAVLAALPFEPAELLYGRIDLVHDPEPLVLEVELVEPSLYLLHGEGAADRLAGLIGDAARAAS